MKIKLAQAYIMVLGFSAATAGAIPWDKPTDAEIAALPPYCMAKMRGVNVEHWQNTLGPIYLHVMHYCSALVYAGRYFKSYNPEERGFFLHEIDANLSYMTRLTDQSQSSALMPEIYFTKGKFLALQGKDAEAEGDFLHAIQLKPDYADPYAAMADFYDRIGKQQDALNILQDGLRQMPTSRSLAQRYQKLGGILPLPEAPPSEDKTAQTKSQAPVPANTEGTLVEAAPLVAPQTSRPAQTPASDIPAEKTGSPSNPWCRFCTDDKPAPAVK